MLKNLKEIVSISMVLFAIIDILGSIPIIIVLRQRAGKIESEKASLVALALMILFLLLGENILNVMGVDIASFAIAGSFVIFFVALEMVLGLTLFKEEVAETASIFPLAFPLIAGAGTMTTLLSLRSQYNTINIIIGIVINVAIIYAVLKNSYRIERILGHTGLVILRKTFGIILLSIAIRLFRTNTGL